MSTNVAFAVFLFSFSLNAVASDYCGNVLNQEKLITCLGDEYSNVDKNLNITYTKLRKSISNSGSEKLKEAQKSWLIFRDKDCEFQASAAEGGQAYQPLYISCQIEKTTTRTDELKNVSW